MSSLDRELAAILAAGAYILDSLFLGLVNTAFLMVARRGGWYRGPSSGERVVYQARHGVISGGFRFVLPNSVVVSDRRFTVRIGWSRAALVNVPVQAILSITRSRWWWYASVVVAFIERTRTRRVRILVSSPEQAVLMTALGSVASIAALTRAGASRHGTA